MFFWLLFCLIITAWLIRYSVTPDSSKFWRIGRVLLAFFISYVLTALWGFIQYSYVHSIDIKTLGSVLVHGLWFIIVYIAFWEWRWRLNYKDTIISIKKGMGDDIASNIFLGVARMIVVVLLIFLSIVAVMTFTE